MRIIVSVKGKFHAFYLARALMKKDKLHRLLTSYPSYDVKRYDIPVHKIKSLVIVGAIERLWNAMPALVKSGSENDYHLAELYDIIASRYIDKADIFIGWSSFSLRCMRKARNLGAKIIIERGSSHILYQQSILKEESLLLGVCPPKMSARIIKKELKEYEEADYIEVPSSFAKRTFLDYGIDEKKLITGLIGVDTREFSSIAKRDGVFRIIYCGTLSIRKGVHYLLEAFFNTNLPDAELWLIGHMEDEMRPFIKKYYNEKVLHVGPLKQKELYKYYSQGSVLVLMSIEDGFGQVILQAMSCGLPVICTNHTGGPDIVREGVDGFILSIRDVKSLQEKITYLYENPRACAEMGQNALRRAHDTFAWDKLIDKISALYDDCAK